MKSIKSILTTGGTGFFINSMRRFLEQNGVSIQDISQINNKRIDITLPFELHFEDNFEIIIHAAGKAHFIPKTSKEEEAFYNINYLGTKNLCSAIDGLYIKPKAFVFISTVSVYGLDKGEMINESHPLNGSTPYAKSKILAEEFLINWAKKNNIILSILRLPLVAGPNPPGNLGAMINGIKTGKYLRIGKAEARKSIVWAEDIAKIIPLLAEKGGIYNLTDGNHPSFKDLEIVIAEALRKGMPFSIPIFFAKILGWIGDILGSDFPINSNKIDKITSTLTFDDTKACEVLNWKPSPVLEKLSEIL